MLFADDKNSYFSGENLECLINRVERELKKIMK